MPWIGEPTPNGEKPLNIRINTDAKNKAKRLKFKEIEL